MKGVSAAHQLDNGCSKCRELEKATVAYQAQADNLAECHKLVLEVALTLRSPSELSTSVDSQELALDLGELIRGQGALKPQEAEHFRVLVMGLNQKLKALHMNQQRLADSRSQARQSVFARESIHASVKDTLAEIERERVLQETHFEDLTAERNQAQTDLRRQVKEHREVVEELTLLQSKHEQLQSDYDQLKAEQSNYTAMSQLIASLQQQVSKSDEARTDLSQQYRLSLQEFEQTRQVMNEEMQQLTQENSGLGSQLAAAKQRIHSLEAERNSQADQIASLHSQNQALKAQLAAAQSQASKATEMEELAQRHQTTAVRLNEKIQELNKQSLAAVNSMDDEKQALLQKAQAAYESELKTESANKDLQTKLSQATAQNLKTNAHLAVVEEKLCIQENSLNIVDQIMHAKQEREDTIQAVYKEFEFMSDFLMAQSEENLSHQRLAGKLQRIMKDKNTEMNLLREMIMELQRYRAYQAVKDDPVDEALAEYLAHRAKPLEVPFVREDQGIYLFGTKRIFMKLEQGRIILRVGGGFMHIDQFVDIYSPLEAEKLSQQRIAAEDPSRRAVLGKIASSVISEAAKGNTEVSPQKAAKLIKHALSGGSSGYTQMIGVPRKSTPVRGPKTRKTSLPSNSFY